MVTFDEHANQVIQSFLSQLCALPKDASHESLDKILQPALDMELELLRSSTSRPDSHSLNPHIGLINPFAIPQNACITRRRADDSETDILFYEHLSGILCSFPKDHLLPLDEKLRRPQGSPCVVSGINAFVSHWDIFTHGALSHSDWSNMIVAGSSVVACLSAIYPKPSGLEINAFFQSNAYNTSDIDIFFWGLTDSEVQAKLISLYSSIRTASIWPTTCVRKADVLLIHSTYPKRTIRIILRLYASPAEVLGDLDVDASCCAYDGTAVFMNPRALVAFIRQANTINIARHSSSYEVKLAKYSNRGFEVYLPSLARQHVDYHMLYRNEVWYSGLARLLVLEIVRALPHHFTTLYRSTGSRRRYFFGPENALTECLDFSPVDERIEDLDGRDDEWSESDGRDHWSENDGGDHWSGSTRIPYNPNWDPVKLTESITRSIASQANALNTRNNYQHKHAVFCSPDIALCIGNVCKSCANETDDKTMGFAEADKYFRGPIKFSKYKHQVSPGKFADINRWAEEAYNLMPGETLGMYPKHTTYGLFGPEFIGNIHPSALVPHVDFRFIWGQFKSTRYGAVYIREHRLLGPDGLPIELGICDHRLPPESERRKRKLFGQQKRL